MATFLHSTPLIPTGTTLSESLAFYTEKLGFSVAWQSDQMAGVARDGVSFNLVQNSSREWADNCSVSIGVSNVDELYDEYRAREIPTGALEMKFWGRREFHMIIPSGVCFQFYTR